MRTLLIIALSLTAMLSFAGVKSELAMGFRIIQDTTDSSVDQGKCLLTGVVMRDGELVKNALVYAQHTRAVRTNANGEFRILLDTADQYLTATKNENLQGYIEGYKFKGGHVITCEVYLFDINEMLIVDKPVIYLYSQKELDVELELKTAMSLTFTYPLINEANKWKVMVNENGIYTASGLSYPYLFWEAETTSLTYRENQEAVIGEILSTDTLVGYLENKLEDFGLNAREKTDFITYWAPRMIQYNYVLTQFNTDAVVEEMAGLMVNPKPDHQRRLFMLFTGFEKYPSIAIAQDNEKMIDLDRSGFTLVEWGGTEVSKQQLYKAL